MLNERYGIRTPIIDLRNLQKDPPEVPKKHRLRGGRVWVRPAEDVTAIGLHQTWCHFGVSKQQVAAAKRVLSKHAALWAVPTTAEAVAKDLRALKIASHVTVFLEPPGPCRIVLANPFEWWVHHGNALNPFTIGVEVEARHAPGTSTLSMRTDQIWAVRHALRLVVLLAKEQGMEIKEIYGHCQSNGNKPNDPGNAIWRAGVETNPGLGLVAPYDVTFRASSPKGKNGIPIPQSWRM